MPNYVIIFIVRNVFCFTKRSLSVRNLTVAMVSIVLLTTEEVLQRNGFWHCLDSLWIAKELEPFEELKPEHAYTKPLSKDLYYTKYPEIPRSESEEENSISLNGFRNKHREWKTKTCVRKFDAQRRHSVHLSVSVRSDRCNTSSNNLSRRVTSLVELSSTKEKQKYKTDDEKVRAFFKRLLENIPPPPLTELQIKENNKSEKQSSKDDSFENIDVPDYADFEKNKMSETNYERKLTPATSTWKKPKQKVSFKLDSDQNKSDFEHCESWYESIYGVSDIIAPTSRVSDDCYNEIQEDESSDFLNEVCEMEYDELSEDNIRDISSTPNESECLASWSEIMTYCGVNDTFLRSHDSLKYVDDIISRSHCNDAKMLDCLVDDDDDEVGYARFAVYKIHETLKLEDAMKDSSSMKDFGGEEDIYSKEKSTNIGNNFNGNIYRLVPVDDVDHSVNVN